jgi:hypothetical protein
VLIIAITCSAQVGWLRVCSGRMQTEPAYNRTETSPARTRQLQSGKQWARGRLPEPLTTSPLRDHNVLRKTNLLPQRTRPSFAPSIRCSQFQRPLRTQRASPAKAVSDVLSVRAVTLAASAHSNSNVPRFANSNARFRVLAFVHVRTPLPLRASLPFGCAPSGQALGAQAPLTPPSPNFLCFATGWTLR